MEYNTIKDENGKLVAQRNIKKGEIISVMCNHVMGLYEIYEELKVNYPNIHRFKHLGVNKYEIIADLETLTKIQLDFSKNGRGEVILHHEKISNGRYGAAYLIYKQPNERVQND
ncbi:hypothetical protein [Methanobacterium paludis]|uniref:Uncharacterized protein n=1 Tax=Methanobacterium paludis (strain DSM 25820 / JCM 18151 / SWAN1) TaxID=868131 RepID=F6D572_METPW|nr:hypothetical protein [Methanobacterium paludis]AEG18180.1 hypothetical protein MSWAN_1162 [Methanobacterium paludis]